MIKAALTTTELTLSREFVNTPEVMAIKFNLLQLDKSKKNKLSQCKTIEFVPINV